MKKAFFAVLPIVGALTWPALRPALQPAATVAAHEGSLRQTLTEPGTVSSSRLLLYGSSISGVQVKIVELVPEGRAVKPGEMLVRFDSTTFEQNLMREEAGLRQAQAEFLRAKEELRIERLRADGETTDAERQIESAKRDLANQTDGQGRVALAEAEAAESDAAREVERATAGYEDMRPLLARGFVTRVELDRTEQALRRAEEQLTLARMRREAVVGFQQPAATARSRASVDAAAQAAARQRETAAARIAEHEGGVRIAASRIDEITAREALLRDQIARAVVRSDAAGMVVYRELFFGNDKRKPQVGDEVWSNQPLIAISDADHLTIESRIREIDMHEVTVGHRVAIRLPAYPDVTLSGAVALVGALAEADPAHAGAKFFPLTVNVDGSDARLRSGMTAEIEIETAGIAHATLIPVEAIFDAGGRATVYVAGPHGTAARTITIAAETAREAAIASGVSIGETLLVKDPTASNAAAK